MSSCVGESCDSRWDCVAHFDDTLQHPCIDDMTAFCGCDGVTFHASSNCPDRPYDHIGACDDGVNCDPADLRCSGVAPSCAAGEYPAIVAGCYGPCVPIASCRCEGSWQCPDHDTQYGCHAGEHRCWPYPLP